MALTSTGLNGLILNHGLGDEWNHAVQVKPILDMDRPGFYYKEALWL